MPNHGNLLLCTTLLLGISELARAIIDNGILGDPYVSCGGNNIEVRFDTRNTFKGLVFVQNHLDEPECRSAPIDDSGLGARNAQIKLNFKDCGLERKRSSNPKGIFLSTSLVVAFHAEFLTKFDRVYHVQCFYMEMENVLEKEISVKMPPPVLQTQQVPMPTCKYEVLAGGPEGPPVFYATIGQMVYHKWTCESSTENQFCMVVHTCIVDDGNGDRVELIDEKGCARDKFLLQNLDYVSDLLVGKEAHVYKYADRPSMFFDCQITLTIKEPGQQYCDVPQCPDPPRRRRGHSENVTDTNRRFSEQSAEKDYILPKDSSVDTSLIRENFAIIEADICMTTFGVSTVAFMNVLMLIGSGLLLRNA